MLTYADVCLIYLIRSLDIRIWWRHDALSIRLYASDFRIRSPCQAVCSVSICTFVPIKQVKWVRARYEGTNTGSQAVCSVSVLALLALLVQRYKYWRLRAWWTTASVFTICNFVPVKRSVSICTCVQVKQVNWVVKPGGLQRQSRRRRWKSGGNCRAREREV